MQAPVSNFTSRSLLPVMGMIAAGGVLLPITAFAINYPPPSTPPGDSSGGDESTSDEEVEPDQGDGKDCDGESSQTDPSTSDSGNGSGEDDCDGCDGDDEPYPEPPSCIRERITLGIAPNEPGLGSGMIQLYIDATNENLASRNYIEFFGLPQMAITSAQNEGSDTNYSIVQAGGKAIPFSLAATIPSGEAAVVGKPTGTFAFSQARATYIGSAGTAVNKSAAASLRHFRGASGFVDYPTSGGNATRYETRQGRVYTFPLPGMEVIRQKDDGTLLINGIYKVGHLRQIKTVAGLLDVVPLTARSYEVRKYPPQQVGTKINGLFSVTGVPVFKMKVEAPANTQNQLTITKTEGSFVSVSHHLCTIGNGAENWTQQIASGEFSFQRVLSHVPMPTLGAGYRTTIQQAYLEQTPVGTTSTGGDPDYRMEVQTYKYAPVSSNQTFSSGASKSRTREFSKPSWDPNGVGKADTQTTSKGSAIGYDYDAKGRMTGKSADFIRPTTGGATVNAGTKAQDYLYDIHSEGETLGMADFRPRTTTVSRDGVTVGKEYFSARLVNGAHVETRQRTIDLDAAYGAASNILSEKQWYGSGDHKGRIQHERHEDGTMTKYEYVNKPDNALEVTTFRELQASGSPLTGHSSRSRVLHDMRGWPLETTRATWVDTAWVDYETIYEVHNAAGRLTDRTRKDLLTNQTRVLLEQEWDGPLLTRMVDEEGVTTIYDHYDGSTIVKSELREAVAAQGGFDAQPEILTTYTGTFTLNKKQVPEWRERITTTTADSLTLTERHVFDQEGRNVSHTDTNGLTTTKVWSQNDKRITETFPDTSTRITTLDSDGRTLSVTGTGVVAKYYHYEPLTSGGTRTTVFTGVDSGPRFEVTDVDASGRTTQVVKPSFDGQANATTGIQYSTSFPKSPVLLSRSSQATSLSDVNSVGTSFRRALTADNATLSLDSLTDRVTEEVVTHEQDAGGLWRVARISVYPIPGSDTVKRVQTTRKKLAGFSGTEVARSESIDVSSNTTATVTSLNGALLTSSTTRPGITGAETSISFAGRLMSQTNPGITGAFTYDYDALGRETLRKDPRHVSASSTVYVTGKNQIDTRIDAASHPTSYTYHANGQPGAGRIRSIALADSTVIWSAYTLRGELMASWGSQTNPTWREYNTYGQLEYLHTWKVAPALDVDAMPTAVPANSATTTWLYDSATGLLSGKRDNEGRGADYYYDVARRLTERKWARASGGTRATTTYGYNNGFDQLGSVTYNDGTPNSSFTYDRLGRTYSAGNGVAGSVHTYDPATLLPDTETVSYDLNGDSASDFTRVFDRSQDTYLRDSGWQLKDGASVENEVEYLYDTAGRLDKVEAPSGLFTYGYEASSHGLVETVTGPVHTVTHTWEINRDVLDLKQNKVGSATVSSYDYVVNAIGQRTDVESGGSAFSSARAITWGYDSLGQVTSADSSIPAHNRSYEYDAIGNRRKSADSLTLPGSDNYTSNSLNQYTNGTTATVVPDYDFDGNATAYPVPAHSSGNSTLDWDGENRLVSATVNSVTTTYLYDAYSRRMATRQGTTAKVVVYDGWNPVAEYSYSSLSTPTTALMKSYAWGLDLSGTLQGAGGVGGLLSVTEHTSTSSDDFYPTYDGNGNVSEYLDLNGSSNNGAHYEYDPFGRTVVATGTKAADFAHRFSTKPLDEATGLYYYTYRYYDPVTGRWPSRDPMEESGGDNLYHMLFNNTLNWVDVLGLSPLASPNAANTWAGAPVAPVGQGGSGKSIGPHLGRTFGKNKGIGSIDNQTEKTFSGTASPGKKGKEQPTEFGPGNHGGPDSGGNNDVDFIYPTPGNPINGNTNGAYKVGPNHTTITPDPEDPNNSTIDDWDDYWPDEKCRDKDGKATRPGYPNR